MLASTRLWTPYGATFETPTRSGIVPVRACCDGRKVLTATLPLASGSCIPPVYGELARVNRWKSWLLTEPGEVFAMHQVDPHESNEFEEAVLCLRHLLQQVKEQKGDQCHGDLNAHGILGATDEMRDLQGLLQQPEEQFNLPTSLVEVCDLLCRRIEIIGEDAQLLARLRHH